MGRFTVARKESRSDDERVWHRKRHKSRGSNAEGRRVDVHVVEANAAVVVLCAGIALADDHCPLDQAPEGAATACFPGAPEGTTATSRIVMRRGGQPSIQTSVQTFSFFLEDVTATSGLDYTASSGTVTIGRGEYRSDEIEVVILQDTTQEPEEFLAISWEQTGGSRIGFKGYSVVPILDDDTMPTLRIGNISVKEDVGTAFVPVDVSQRVGLEITVDYETSMGTAKETADYAATTGTLTIPAGSIRGHIGVSVVDDDVDEENETLSIRLSNPVNAVLP